MNADFLVRYYETGDTTACDAFGLEVSPWLRERIRRDMQSGTRNADLLVEDVLNRVLEKVAATYQKHRSRWSPEKGSLKAWLGRIAFNALKSEFRKLTRDKRRVTNGFDELGELGGQAAENRLREARRREEDQQRYQQVMGHAEHLPPVQRHILFSKTLGSMSFRQIGNQLGMNEQKARRLYQKAVDHLQAVCVLAA